MSTTIVLPALEAIGAAASRHRRDGEAEPLLRALIDALDPRRVLLVDTDGGAGVLHAATSRLDCLVVIDSMSARVERTATAANVGVHHARLGGVPREVPHFTRDMALVDTLRGPGFDLIVVAPPADPAGVRLTLGILLPLLAPDGILCVAPLAGDAGALDAVARVVAESAGPAVVWRPDGDAPAAALLGLRRALHNHEEARVWCAAEPGIAAARAAGDDAAICAALRHWLAPRLVWSTSDLLLPLAELPPRLAVQDVVDRCARREGGVWPFGAAVTLAMLYRACGYPATVYQYGVGDLFWSMATLVRLPDGRILVEDAFFDAELRLGDAPMDWRDALGVVHAGRAGTLTFTSSLRAPRAHLYSRASLAAAEVDGYVSADERRALAAAMDGCRRLGGEPRAVLMQTATRTLAGFLHIPANTRALAAVRARTGIVEPLALLGLPCGTLPLSGDVAFDRDIATTLDDWDRLAHALAVGA